MSDPIVFISSNKIKAGKVDELRRHYLETIPPIMAGKPGTLAQLAYENEEGTEVTIVRLFPSADALDLQIQGADERSKKPTNLSSPLALKFLAHPTPLR